MYNTILFDLDGTLTDPAEGITNSVAYALSKFGINITDMSELYCFIGPPLVDAFMRFYNFTEEQAKEAVGYYREHFRSVGILQNEMFDGVPEMLSSLKQQGKTIALATCKPEPFADVILKHFDIYKYFDFLGGATFYGTRSQKGEVIAYVLEELKITDKKTVLMIGDRYHDIDGAKENDIDSVGVLFGYGDYEELTSSGATYIAKTLDDIMKFI